MLDITIHLVCFLNVLEYRRKDFLKCNVFTLYYPYSLTLGPHISQVYIMDPVFMAGSQFLRQVLRRRVDF